MNNVKDAVIQQINVTYIATEDRLLLKIAVSEQEELAIWLTRRVVKMLWELLNHTEVIATVAPELNAPEILQQTQNINPHSPQTKSLLQEFAKDAATQKLNFSEQYQARNTINEKAPLLVNDCQITATNKNTAFLELLCSQEQTVRVALNSTLLLALVNILKLAVQQAAWDSTISEHATALLSSNNMALLH